MSTRSPLELGRAWIDAFNAHDVPRLVALYDRDATHSSPKLRAQHPETGGHVRGHEALTRWWQDAIARLPTLHYVPQRFTADGERVFIEYVRQVSGEADMPVAEVFDVRDGRIVASRVYHG